MLTFGFNISCSHRKHSNNMFYGFSSVKCATSSIFSLAHIVINTLFSLYFNLTSCLLFPWFISNYVAPPPPGFTIWRNVTICLNALDMKLVPWSVWIISGKPNVVKNLINALVMAGAVIFLRGIASGKRVDMHITVSRNWLPAFVLGNGPTQSTRTCSNGSPTAGIGCSGAGCTTWLGLPTNWHVLHVLQNWVTWDFIPGQKKCLRTRP